VYSVIPEFPSVALLLLMMILSIFTVAFAKKTAQKKTQTSKLNLHTAHS
jgi:type III secretory pathway component EscV